MFTLRRPIQTITLNATLRVLSEKRFALIWTDNNWQTSNSTQSRGLGSAGFAADIHPDQRQNPSGLSLTFFWPEENRWLGHNYERVSGPIQKLAIVLAVAVLVVLIGWVVRGRSSERLA